MHTSILQYILNFTIDFIYQTELVWDTGTWTIWSYIVFCFVWFVVWYFIWQILLFARKKGLFGDE